MALRHIGLTALVAALLAPAPLVAGASPALALAPGPADGDTVRVMVELDVDTVPESGLSDAAATRQRDRIDAAVAGLVSELPDGVQVEALETVPSVVIEATPDALAALAASDEIVDVAPERFARPLLDSSVPAIAADVTTAAGWDGTGWNVAVLDTGVQSSHPFFAASAAGSRVVAEACFSTADGCPNLQSTDTSAGAAAPCDYHAGDCGHGTHVAGIAAGAQPADASGPTAGVAPGAGIVAVQVFHESNGRASASSFDIAAALDWVLQHHATHAIAAVNMSLGSVETFAGDCDAEDPTLTALMQSLAAAGVATVVAAGNHGADDAMSWPACLSPAISVGATTDLDTVATFSNTSSTTDLLAPGSDIESALPGDTFASKSGTSMAAPHVAGAWAALREAVPAATVDEVRSALRATGTLLDDLVVLGLPRIDLDDALARLTLAPGAPTGVAASAGNAKATVAWAAPADAGGSAVTDYRVAASPTTGVAGEAARLVGSATTSLVFDGLTNGETYTFTVTALSERGESAASTPSNEVRPRSSGGGGGGGGGGGSRTTTTTRAPTTTTSIPPVTAPGPDDELVAVPIAPGAAVSGGQVLTIRDGKAIALPNGAPAGTVVTGGAVTPSGKGAWSVTGDGRVFTSGDAPDLGSAAGTRLNAPIVGIAPTPSGRGYWLLGGDGGIFSFGDARFHGSTGAMRLNQPVVGMASTARGDGYWLFAGDGGIFTFGGARFFGSTGGRRLNAPVTTMAATPTGRGYWLLGADGGVFTFGDARFAGSTGSDAGVGAIEAIVPTATGKGYWLIGRDARLHRFGDAT